MAANSSENKTHTIISSTTSSVYSGVDIKHIINIMNQTIRE